MTWILGNAWSADTGADPDPDGRRYTVTRIRRTRIRRDGKLVITLRGRATTAEVCAAIDAYERQETRNA